MTITDIDRLDRNAEDAAAGVALLLASLVDDIDTDGLRDTPERVVRALRDMTSGGLIDVAALIATTFPEASRDMVVVEGIEFVSVCEHHLMPFAGVATVGYIPNGRVIGLSKIPRIVDAFARRLQLQERMTRQVADALMTIDPEPDGVAVLARATHGCMAHRGTRQAHATMLTSAVRGSFESDPATRAEFMSIANRR